MIDVGLTKSPSTKQVIKSLMLRKDESGIEKTKNNNDKLCSRFIGGLFEGL
jgi:hypothetical protein